MLKGQTVTLSQTVKTGEDPFGEDTYEETTVDVANVLIGEPSTDDVTTAQNLYGKRIAYMLGIPKGDTHDWKDKTVTWTMPNGQTMTCKTFGFPVMGVEANIPTPWHMKVRCEAYER